MTIEDTSATPESGEAAAPTQAQTTEGATDTSLTSETPAESGATEQAAPAEGAEPTAEGDKPEAESKEDGTKEDTDAADVPETYTFEMPEGMPLDEAAAGELTTVAHELKLSQDQVTKLTKIGVQMRQRDAENHAKLVKEWSEAMQTDSELGGEKFPENLAVARSTLQKYASPGLREILRATGLDQHPEMFRFVHKLGSDLAEDTFAPGGSGVSMSEEAKAKRMYPSMNKQR